jgi:hypothetical protein
MDDHDFQTLEINEWAPLHMALQRKIFENCLLTFEPGQYRFKRERLQTKHRFTPHPQTTTTSLQKIIGKWKSERKN